MSQTVVFVTPNVLTNDFVVGLNTISNVLMSLTLSAIDNFTLLRMGGGYDWYKNNNFKLQQYEHGYRELVNTTNALFY